MAKKKQAKDKKNFLVKAIRRGFYEKVRNPDGKKFVIKAHACPSWCVEVSPDGKVSSNSKAVKVTEAQTFLTTLKTADEVNAFVEGDDRAGVKAGAEEALARIANETA